MTDTAPQSGYAPVNGLEMYYEIHGADQADRPLVLLHGAYMTIDTFGALLPGLAATRQVIVPEFQAHGHTADADRPLSYEQMADDTAALLRHIGVENVDVFGYSMGGGVSLQLAIRHPELVRKLVAASATFNTGGIYPELLEMIETITPEVFAGSPYEAAYLEVAPNPGDFPTLVEKLKQLDLTSQDWPPESIQEIAAPTMIVIADSDVVRPEHAVEMFRLLGGGVAGDLAGLPNSQLAVLPGTTHVTLVNRIDWLLSMIGEFLDAPMPEGQ